MENQEQISMKQAVAIATITIQELYLEESLEDLLLEEVLLDSSSRGEEWKVTLGFARPYSSEIPGPMRGLVPQAKPRDYKRLLIDAHTGEVRGMLDGRIDAD